MSALNRIAMWLLLGACILVLSFSPANATQFKQVELDDTDFLLLNIGLQQQQLIYGADAYYLDEQTLLPVSQLTSALGAGITLDIDAKSFVLSINNNSIAINLEQQTSSQPLDSIESEYFWGSDGYELYLSHLLLEKLLAGKIAVQLSTLSASIASVDELFPIEKQWQRIKNLSSTNKEQAKEERREPLYVDDKYQLLTPPTANLNLSLSSRSDENTTQTIASYNTQATADILYHSAQISLNQTNKSKLISRINFSRHRPNPEQSLWGGLRQYSFGDISTSNQALLNNTPAGLGIQLAQRPDNFSRRFGSRNIEGDATPGWEVELYRNGFLIETSKVPDNGHYLFSDIDTEYGNNHFEVRLYGPHGEEESRRENISIGSNWLPKGEFAYDAYLLDRNRTLLSSAPKGASNFGSDMGFSFDYSPFNNTAIGSFYQRSRDSATDRDDFQQYIGTHVQSAFSDLLLDLQVVKQAEFGHRISLRGSGRLPWEQNYNFHLENNRDFSNHTTPTDSNDFNARINTGNLLPFIGKWRYDTTLTYRSSEDSQDIWSGALALSGRMFGVYFTNSLNYTHLGLSDATNPISGNLSLSTSRGRFRLNGGLNYSVQPNTRLNSVNLSGAWRSVGNGYQTARVDYSPNASSSNRWDFSYGYSQDFELFRLGLDAQINSGSEWAVKMIMNFFVDYDAHNRRFLLSSRASSSSGNLNLTAYLDRNNNNRRDEADWTLEGVSFSPLPLWKDLTTNKEGKVSLPGIPPDTPFSFSAKWQDGVATRQGSYTVFTHPGSRIDVDIPFEIKTNVSGFALAIGGGQEYPLTSGKVELINLDNKERLETTLDIDGFFEFVNLKPGHYGLQITDETRQRLNLVAQEGQLIFETPSTGGDFEIPLFLLRADQNDERLPETTKIVLDEQYGEGFYFEDLPDGQQIYSAPWDYRLTLDNTNGESRQSSDTPLLPPTAVTSDRALTNEAQKSTVTDTSATDDQSIILQAAKTANYILSLSGPKQTVVQQAQLPNPTNSTNRYYLQVGAFSQHQNAKNWLDQHPKIASDCMIGLQTPLYIVRCGRFAQRLQATEYRQQLRSSYPSLQPVVKLSPIAAIQPQATVNLPTPAANVTQSSSYTIQLLVASQQTTLSAFINQYQLQDANTRVTNKQLNGKQVKVLTLGQFDTSANARTALSKLSTPLRQQAWITKFTP